MYFNGRSFSPTVGKVERDSARLVTVVRKLWSE